MGFKRFLEYYKARPITDTNKRCWNRHGDFVCSFTTSKDNYVEVEFNKPLNNYIEVSFRVNDEFDEREREPDNEIISGVMTILQTFSKKYPDKGIKFSPYNEDPRRKKVFTRVFKTVLTNYDMHEVGEYIYFTPNSQ